MATYDDFKTSGVKGVDSLDALFVVEATVDTTEQNLVQNDLVDLFDLPANTAVVGVLLEGQGATDEGATANIEVGTSADPDAVLTATDVREEDLNSYSAGSVFFPDETTIKLKATTDLTYDKIVLRVALVCVTI